MTIKELWTLQSPYMYTEYHSVCTLVEIGTTPNTSPPSKCAPPPQNQRVGGTLACGWGVGGVSIPTTGGKA